MEKILLPVRHQDEKKEGGWQYGGDCYLSATRMWREKVGDSMEEVLLPARNQDEKREGGDSMEEVLLPVRNQDEKKEGGWQYRGGIVTCP